MFVPVPDHANPDFYQKAFEWRGIHVVGAPGVSDAAMVAAAEMLFNTLRSRPDIVERLAEAGSRFAISDANDRAVTLPEFSYWADDPSLNWAVGLGSGGPGNPVSSSSEVEILGLPGDEYPTQAVAIHEFAHLVDNVGLGAEDTARLEAAYAAAMSAGLWQGTYAATNSDEYFAELTEAFFDHERSPDSSKNFVNTRGELAQYDPEGYALMVSIYGDDDWRDGDWLGSAGSDVLVGSALGDLIFGQGGGDSITGGLGDDAIYGGDGVDTAAFQYASGQYAILWTFDGWKIAGREGNDYVFEDVEQFSFAGSVHDAGEFKGLVEKGSGADETIDGTAADDTLWGRGGQDLIRGREGRDVLVGDNARDNLNGGGAADVLDGGAGNDVLRGAGGKDVFLIDELGNTDRIRDFELGRDTVMLDDTLWGGADLSAQQIVDLHARELDGYVMLVFEETSSKLRLDGIADADALVADMQIV